MELIFQGRFIENEFLAFAEHCAQRLSIEIKVQEATQTVVRFSVNGPDALVDAFEAALSLGPISCLILDVSRC